MQKGIRRRTEKDTFVNRGRGNVCKHDAMLFRFPIEAGPKRARACFSPLLSGDQPPAHRATRRTTDALRINRTGESHPSTSNPTPACLSFFCFLFVLPGNNFSPRHKSQQYTSAERSSASATRCKPHHIVNDLHVSKLPQPSTFSWLADRTHTASFISTRSTLSPDHISQTIVRRAVSNQDTAPAPTPLHRTAVFPSHPSFLIRLHQFAQ